MAGSVAYRPSRSGALLYGRLHRGRAVTEIPEGQSSLATLSRWY